jgi:two-component system phosphate regulon sensor histidine kinase PhoR
MLSRNDKSTQLAYPITSSTMTPRPFLPRLILPFAVAMALIVAVCGAVIYWAGERTARLQQVEDLDRLATFIHHTLASSGDVTPADRARLTDSARVLGTRITLIAGSGTVLLDTDAAPERMENHNDRPEVIAARRELTGRGVRFSNTLREPAVYVARLVDPARPDGLVLRLSYPRHAWAHIGASAWVVVAGAVAAALLVTTLLWLMLLRQWINPVRRLAAAAERMAAGEWSQRVSPGGADDVQFFSEKLNLLASQAERSLADLRHQRADLRALVDTLPDPIVAIDHDRRVTLINPPAAELLGVAPEQAALRQRVESVVSDEAVLKLVDAVTGGPPDAGPGAGAITGPGLHGPQREPVEGEVRLVRRGQRFTYHAVAIPTAGGGAVLVLRDVSALAGTLQMKTDFVANASHELRTPIAAIKIAFETLREVYADDPGQAERCIRIMDGHMLRLEDMLRDLMDLSRVESPETRPDVRELKASELFAHLRASLGPMAREKGVELRFRAEDAAGRDAGDGVGNGTGNEPGVRLLSDERLLNLTLKNLVENSIKFTPAGGTVTVAVRLVAARGGAGANGSPPAAGEAVVSVADTGIGIPPEHLDRVFERFYQVDSARSGSAGRGTGLGLAIVKHAVAALGGTVRLESRVGRGTTVTCVLPQGSSGATRGATLVGSDERVTH